MRIKGLEINELWERKRRIHEKLDHASTRRILLEQATDETPAIAELFVCMHKIANSKKAHTGKCKKLLLLMENEFVLLLAMWEIEKEEESRKPNLKIVGDDERRSRRRN